MKGQIEKIPLSREDLSCEKCKQVQVTVICLQCNHIFCMICASFMYAKSQKSLKNQNFIRCIKCEAVTCLEEEHVEMINETLQSEVIPNIEEIDRQTIPSSDLNHTAGHRYIETLGRKIKSEEHSFQMQGTPSTIKCFFSKCQSPSERKRSSNPDNPNYCAVHQAEPITHICFSCAVRPLCLRCVTNTRKHSGHDLKQLKKGVNILSEKLTQTQIDLNKKIQEMELIQKRLNDRSGIIKERGSKFMMDLRDGFAQLFEKLQQKSQQVTKLCQDHYASLLEQIKQENKRISFSISLLKNYKQKMQNIQSNSPIGVDIISKFTQLKSQMGHLYQQNFSLHEKKNIQMPSSFIFREIKDIAHKINNVVVEYKYCNFCRVGASDLETCLSESKFKKDYQLKRIKTNFVSLNSSRDKKEKKIAKTEEDEKKYKDYYYKAKGLDKEKKGKVPNYITTYINKKGNDGSSFRMEATSPNNLDNSSKLTSKLSKTISPEQFIKKKREKTSTMKERMERKTTQPSSKGWKKKKNH